MAASRTFGEINKDCQKSLEPLTLATLEGVTGSVRADMLGIRIFPIVQSIYPMSAGKITGMLIQLNNAEVLELLKDENNVLAKAHEAIDLLQKYQGKQANPKPSNYTVEEKF